MKAVHHSSGGRQERYPTTTKRLGSEEMEGGVENPERCHVRYKAPKLDSSTSGQ